MLAWLDRPGCCGSVIWVLGCGGGNVNFSCSRADSRPCIHRRAVSMHMQGSKNRPSNISRPVRRHNANFEGQQNRCAACCAGFNQTISKRRDYRIRLQNIALDFGHMEIPPSTRKVRLSHFQTVSWFDAVASDNSKFRKGRSLCIVSQILQSSIT